MIPANNGLILFRFGALKWIRKQAEGKISFSCPGYYIDIAQKSGNLEQGDLDEGIFARLKKGDARIKQMDLLLSKDLEVIDDGGYVKGMN